MTAITGFDPAQGKVVPIACTVQNTKGGGVRIKVAAGYSLLVLKGGREVAISDGDDTWIVHVSEPGDKQVINLFYYDDSDVELRFVNVG